MTSHSKKPITVAHVKMSKKTKRQLWEQIQEYNDEFFWPQARGMSIKELEEYLAELKKYYDTPKTLTVD